MTHCWVEHVRSDAFPRRRCGRKERRERKKRKKSTCSAPVTHVVNMREHARPADLKERLAVCPSQACG